MSKFLPTLLFLVILITPAHFGNAACGDIISEYDYGDGNGPIEERSPIEDCDNPFGVTENPTSSLILKINDAEPVASYEVEEGTFPADFSFSVKFQLQNGGEASSNDVFSLLYRHEGEDYRDVTGFNADNDLVIQEPGTYTFVNKLFLTTPGPLSLQQKIREFFIPTAHAFSQGLSAETFATTFTIEEVPAAPEGASSVLFLPGIMGSRLFEEGEFCESISIESQLWLSYDNECRQLRLSTNFLGQSTNEVYTKSGVDGILDEVLGLNLYKSFIGRLKDMKEDNTINDYVLFPYDWRANLNNILKSGYRTDTEKIFTWQVDKIEEGLLYQELNDLADSSNSGKVTVVAHSNGGLVIKQLLRYLQSINDPLLNKIDNVILVGVPQLGAPKSAIGILHGEEIFPVMSQTTTRRLMNTMPFSHHLLPTTGYFESVYTPVISFEEGEATNEWIDSFGDTISSRDGLHQFLSKDSGRTKPEFEDLETPEVVDISLLDYAKTAEVTQRDLVAVPSMKIYQIAGVGLETPTSLEYFSDRECVSRILFFICTEYSPKISYRVDMTIDGDGTVPVPSALALAEEEQVERRWVNLQLHNIFKVNREHNNLLEVTDIINFIDDTVQHDLDQSYNYLSETEPLLVGDERLIFQLHSPLDMSIVTSAGKKVSSSTNEIDSATYQRYGELQYISIPSDEDFTLVLDGLATGSFTLDVEKKKAGELLERHTYSAIPSILGTKVTMVITEDAPIEDAILVVDYDNDGIDDLSYDTAGVLDKVTEITYDNLYQVISSFGMRKLQNSLMLKLVKRAEKSHKKAIKNSKHAKLERVRLHLLLRQAKLYERFGFISEEERVELENVVIRLLNKD